MTNRTATGFLHDPDTVIAIIARGIEPTLTAAMVKSAIAQAAPSRAQRRRLAHALYEVSDLLTSGRPEGPPQVERLIAPCRQPALAIWSSLAAGTATNPNRSHNATARSGSARPATPVGAGQPTMLTLRYRETGRRPQPGRRPAVRQLHLVPGPRSGRRTLRGDQRAGSESRPAKPDRADSGRDSPTVPASPGALGTSGASRTAHRPGRARLAARQRPHPCPDRCRSPRGHRAVLPVLRPDSRVDPSTRRAAVLPTLLRPCDEHPCSRCHQRKQVASRTSAGDPVCNNCFRADRANHERCSQCGRAALVYRHGDGQPHCRRCRAPTATCSICGNEKPCLFASTDRPRCENCSRRMLQLPCTRCRKTLPVWSRTSDGHPLCGNCCARRETCHDCGRIRKVVGRIPDGPLCSTCYPKHPVSFRPCSNCGTTERLHHHGLCTRCACHQQLLALLCHPDGDLHPHMQPVFHVLVASEPATVLRWLGVSAARTVLAEAGELNQPLTHDLLDRYPNHQAIDHLRKVFVAGDVLSRRDEYLAAFERWIGPAIGKVSDPEERRIIRRFAVWHQLRRLRARAERGSLTTGQAQRARAGVRAAITLAAWLRANNTTLATCSQRHIDRWIADGRSTNYNARPFVERACRNGHAHDIAIPEPPRGSTTRIQDDQRWALVRQLLHDDTGSIEDRVAGLLLLLYGQPLQSDPHNARPDRRRARQRPTHARSTSAGTPATAGHTRAAPGRKPPQTRSPRPYRRPPLAASRWRTRASTHLRPTHAQAPKARDPSTASAQHGTVRSRRTDPRRRLEQATGHPHQHRDPMDTTNRRYGGRLRR